MKLEERTQLFLIDPLSALYLINGTEMTTPTKLDSKTSAENTTKIIANGPLVSLKQHSSSHMSTQVIVLSVSKHVSQKVLYDTTQGIKRAMLAKRLMPLAIKNTKAKVFLMPAIPIIRIARMALMREKVPRMKPRVIGMGPLNSTESHAMMEERRDIEQSRKIAASKHAIIVTIAGTLAILCLTQQS